MGLLAKPDSAQDGRPQTGPEGDFEFRARPVLPGEAARLLWSPKATAAECEVHQPCSGVVS